jgi:hypothetical protein
MTIDISRAPRGELVAAELVAAFAEHGLRADLTERHYLELKGPESLDSKQDKQKIAKFILGAANRWPERAAEAFEGYGVMVIGITKNGVVGIEPIEMLELQKVIKPFLGEAGPRWDVVRVPVQGSTKQVLVVLVDPPQMGQPAFICRASGDKISSGHIYFRDDGETRQAQADEVDMLAERGAARPAAPVDIEVSTTGSVVPLIVDEAQTLDAFINMTRRRLLDALPKPKAHRPTVKSYEVVDATAEPAGALAGAVLKSIDIGLAGMLGSIAEDRTESQYRNAIDIWERRFREAWPDAITTLASYLLDPVETTVRNKTQTFMHDVEIKVHLEGAVTASSYFEPLGSHDDYGLETLELPLPPHEWGPTQRDYGLRAIANLQMPHFDASVPRPSRITWRNSGSVDFEVILGDLRPEANYTTEEEELVLFIVGTAPEAVNGTWSATARGYNEVFKGKIEVEVAAPRDVTERLRVLLGIDDEAEQA